MKRTLRIAAVVLFLVSIVFWAATGANAGWTKDKREVKTMDDVTGLEGITYEKHFSPGVDFLGLAALGAGVLAGISFLFRNNQTETKSSPS